MAATRSRSWRLDLLLFTVFMALYTVLGGYLSMVKHYLPYDALSRLVSAWLVWRGTEVKLATIGFVWPPIPTAILIPLAWIPPLVESWMALVLVSAFFMATSVVLVSRILRYCGITGIWRYLLAILFGINPLNLVFGANGMSEAILVAACLGSFYAFLRFWDSGRNLQMMISALLFSLLPLIRYEFAILSLAAGAALVVHCWKSRPLMETKQFNDFLEGRLLAFSSLAIYPLFLWCIVSWQIMDNPFYFLVNDRSAISLAAEQLSGQVMFVGAAGAFNTVFYAWFVTFPAGLVGTLALLFLGWRARSAKYLVFALLPLLIPALQFIMLLQGTNVPLLRYFMTTVMFGVVTIAIAMGAIKDLTRLNGWRYHLLGLAAVALVLGSNFLTRSVIEDYPYLDIETVTWRGISSDEMVEHQDFAESYKVGQVLPSLIPPGSRVLIDTYQYGFGIVLGSNNPQLFMDFTDPNYDKAVLNPYDYADYVIVPKTEGRGALYSINRYHPNLHESGAAWAEPVEGLPDTISMWRLYKVKKE